MKNPLIKILRLYQLSRVLRSPACRFYPTCSDYAIQSIEKFGTLRGCCLAAYRVCRCQPLSPGGVEYAPQNFADPFESLFQSACERIRSIKKAAKRFVILKQNGSCLSPNRGAQS